MQGVSLAEDLEPILQMIETGFYHKAKKAVLTAVKELGREFDEIKSQNQVRTTDPNEA